MATSGNTSWELQRNDIIAAAMRKIGALAKGQTPDTEDYTNGAQALNSLISLFSTDGMPLWKRMETTVALVDGTASYTLTSSLKLTQVVLRSITSSVQYELTRKSLYDFNALPDTDGMPVHYTYSPGISDGTLRLWPTPDSSSATEYEVIAVYQKEFDGFFTATDTPDFPPYWTDALIYGLAVRLAPEFGLPLNDRNLLIKEAEMYKKMAADYGDEDESIYFQPDGC
jgi:hypothetical protein